MLAQLLQITSQAFKMAWTYQGGCLQPNYLQPIHDELTAGLLPLPHIAALPPQHLT